ncbi:MAG: T9SS type A sorting domain-containing protein [Flavobacteriales bacterium]|nr:T9SS type A sorting domain-containing protein [Flavobacteriales bacterium]
MKKITHILILFFISVSVNAQIERFNRAYDMYGWGDYCSNVFETNYGYLVCGNVKDSLGNPGLGFLRIDFQGNEIDKKFFAGPNQMNYQILNGVANYTDSTIYFAGIGQFPNLDISAIVVKTNMKGDTIWSKFVFDTTYNSQGGAIYREINGDLLIVGSTDRTDPNVNILLVKTDSLGNFIWDKEYGVMGTYDTGWSIDKCDNDNGYVIGGGKYYFGPQIGRSYIINVDSSGNFQWQYEYGSTIYQNWSAMVLYTQNNQIISAAAKGFYKDITDNFWSKPNIQWLDENGGFINYREYAIDSFPSIAFDDLYEINANEYLFTGTFLTYPDQRMGLLKTNAGGDTIFGRTYQGINQWEFSKDVKPTSDGGYIIAGFNYPGLNGVSQNYRVIKVDSLGCDTLGCETVGIMEYENSWNENENLLAFPNPSIGKFYIEIKNVPISPFFETKVEVYDLVGNMIFQSGNRLFQNLTEIDISNASPGIYLVKVFFNKNSVGSIRIIKE